MQIGAAYSLNSIIVLTFSRHPKMPPYRYKQAAFNQSVDKMVWMTPWLYSGLQSVQYQAWISFSWYQRSLAVSHVLLCVIKLHLCVTHRTEAKWPHTFGIRTQLSLTHCISRFIPVRIHGPFNKLLTAHLVSLLVTMFDSVVLPGVSSQFGSTTDVSKKWNSCTVFLWILSGGSA